MGSSGADQKSKYISIKEKWTIEIDTSGGAKVNIITKLKNTSDREQKFENEAYEFIFGREESPEDFQCYDVYTQSPRGDFQVYTIYLNMAIEPFGEKEISINLNYSDLAKVKGNWWDISLHFQHGDIFPNSLKVECILPMEAKTITSKSGKIQTDIKKKIATISFINTKVYNFMLTYKLPKIEWERIAKIWEIFKTLTRVVK